MSGSVVAEVAGGQELGLHDVVEAELADGHQDGSTRGPVGAVEQLLEAFLAKHLQH